MKWIWVGLSQRPAHNEKVCGDSAIVIPEERYTFIAVVDGLGHGPQAARAAQAFCSIAEENRNRPLQDILMTAHEGLGATRGVAAALVRIEQKKRELFFSGIGNIGIYARSRETIQPISSSGIVGHHVKPAREFKYSLYSGDIIAIFTDGIQSAFEIGTYKHLDVEEMADAILTDHGKAHDDATCVVIRCGPRI